MASMMDEMAKTLARRREKAEKKPEVTLNIFILVSLYRLSWAIVYN